MPPFNKPQKISLEAFQQKTENLQLYEGLVEGVGYVYWVPVTMYFAEIRSKHSLGPIYRGYIHITSLFSARKGSIPYGNNAYEYTGVVKTHIRKDLKVISPDLLEYNNYAAYLTYHNGIAPIKNDAIKIQKTIEPNKRSTIEKIRDNLEPINSVGNAIGIPMGIAGELGIADKILGPAGKIFDGVSIFTDIVDGEYFSAGFTLVKHFSGWYGVAWDIGVWMNDSSLINTRIARSSALEYKHYESLYIRADKAGDYKAAAKYRKKMSESLKLFQKSVDKLDIKY